MSAMSADSAYDKFWEAHQSGTPDDWRGEQHEPFTPDPEFVTLCADAERRRLAVGLSVSGGSPAGVKDCPFRYLSEIVIGFPGDVPVLAVSFGVRESLRSAAARAREQLERR